MKELKEQWKLEMDFADTAGKDGTTSFQDWLQIKGIVKPWQTAETEQECFYEMENDLERFELPICFDAREEQKELNLRHMRLKELSKRYFRRFLSIPKQPIKQ